MSHVAVVGAGVIGRAWVVQLAAYGVRVTVSDPDPKAATLLARDVEQARPALSTLGLDVADWHDRVQVVESVAEAVDGARFVQESGPEREDVRAALFGEIDEAAPAGSPVASSTSTMPPSRLAALAPLHPERFVVGHPFNPVHLVPLVEVVGSDVTSPDVLARALEFYREVGKRPIHVRREVPGHLANRLQAALWREAYSLVEQGVASVADVDAAIAHGPGLRWALLGPLANQHLSGGEGGLRHVLEHLGPPTQELMDDLGSARLDDALTDALVSGVDAELAGIDQHAMSADRDALLVHLLAAKSRAQHLP
ncbi:3-hydroxyacyl-CoA dehydrogenase NAD-binding domain-containing protein [Aeromicrobium sp. CTD01-1L150]|uniref:3-hydroxyacyl-CoA dehydrogenase NAD-binding domain-containing protein n=1 Tax=Aeromicrobium sp. CTD01-1L150 TaxID=3341830 RepID=UPI0035BFE2BC